MERRGASGNVRGLTHISKARVYTAYNVEQLTQCGIVCTNRKSCFLDSVPNVYTNIQMRIDQKKLMGTNSLYVHEMLHSHKDVLRKDTCSKYTMIYRASD